METDDVVVASAAFIVIATLAKKKRKRRWWETKIYRDRLPTRGRGFVESPMEEEESGRFFNFMRMSSTDYHFILEQIRGEITRDDTTFRKAVTVEERLAITLRYLATGDSFTSLQYLFNASKQLISRIVPEVCRAIVNALIEHVKIPSSTEEWMEISRKFDEVWNFPHCLGALDGKHIVLQAPMKSGSLFYNYKSTFSIVLMALVDDDYNFIFVDIGCQGGVSDGGVFKNCQLCKDLENNKLNLPAPSCLPGRTMEVPHVIVADAAFPLSGYIMKPYAGIHPKGCKKRIYNCQLCRARRVAENAFGVLSAIFRVLRKPMLLEPNEAEIVVMATICLHNFLRKSSSSRNTYTPEGTFEREVNGEIIRGTWRTTGDSGSMQELSRIAQRSTVSANDTREEFANYFTSNGSVPWQGAYA